ncbi:hypothetical protein SLS59_001895 [Nothophoma quercina]|uniref:Uncharacterized protein n=1 Tax=Nothophoma quercina TaxID=749835 RepID=A0ABR3RWB0_9PLEO
MSKKWTPELDSILLHGVFEECQISFGKALCEKIAERVRAAGVEGFTEVTPKAVENRLYSWKKKNVKIDANGEAATATPNATPKKGVAKKGPATPKTKTPRAKKGAAKKKVDDEEAGDEDQLESPSAGRKRKSESEEENEDKKVKIESLDAVEDDGVMGGGEEEV